eukprot:CAMPEP_0114620700 /NCGR_PEP_ID=MMETSP0168-20121206/8859_1 /TAXON_ID=95228 ORGANISM="Vannella sp., Strain DIVA3 517/6/12" /NCGR_SAMPLE_ID=MMETSP0168 /ASSEMBLY_ACC=CAM_ASM_000044 /LENGTH=277 /DNA_ID=CAMNT_0001831897 /DNA_START=1 /DNA_END=832 /DNA_ORIENTATION=-
MRRMGGCMAGAMLQQRAASSTVQLVREVRQRTGAGIMDCKKALESNDMDVEAAVQALASEARVAVGRLGRSTSEGCLGVAQRGPTAVLCELQSETDFVAKMEDFRRLASAAAEAALEAGAAVPAEGTASELAAADVLKSAVSDGSSTVEEALSKMIFSTKETVSLKRALAVRAPAGGAVGVYLHGVGKQAAVVALDSKGADAAALEQLAKDLAVHVVASSPKVLAKEDLVAGEHKADDALLEQDYIMASAGGSVAEALQKAGASVRSFVHAVQGSER